MPGRRVPVGVGEEHRSRDLVLVVEQAEAVGIGEEVVEAWGIEVLLVI